MIYDRKVRSVELRGQMRFCHGHADAVRKTLTQRAGSDLDAGRQSVFRVSRCFRSPLAKVLDLVERKLIAGQMQQRVKQHASVARRKQEAIAVLPLWLLWVVAHELCPQDVSHRRRSQGQTRMAGFGV